MTSGVGLYLQYFKHGDRKASNVYLLTAKLTMLFTANGRHLLPTIDQYVGITSRTDERNTGNILNDLKYFKYFKRSVTCQ